VGDEQEIGEFDWTFEGKNEKRQWCKRDQL